MKIGIYVLVMAVVTYLIRMLPLTLFKKEIRNKFLLSVLHYIPYACLATMTVPSIFYATKEPVAGAVGLAAALVAAWRNLSMISVALIACGAVFLTERILSFLP